MHTIALLRSRKKLLLRLAVFLAATAVVVGADWPFTLRLASVAFESSVTSFSTGIFAVFVSSMDWALRNWPDFRGGFNMKQALRAFGFVGIAWTAVFLYHFCWTVPRNVYSTADSSRLAVRVLPMPPRNVPIRSVKTDRKAEPSTASTGIALSVQIAYPSSPVIIVENLSDRVADGVLWELVMFRRRDHALFSYPGQRIGFVKAHSKSASYFMDLNRIAPSGTPQISPGDSFVGSLAVDCPMCDGVTLMLSINWGSSGWYSVVPTGHGKFILPANLETDGMISRYIDTIDGIEPGKRLEMKLAN